MVHVWVLRISSQHTCLYNVQSVHRECVVVHCGEREEGELRERQGLGEKCTKCCKMTHVFMSKWSGWYLKEKKKYLLSGSPQRIISPLHLPYWSYCVGPGDAQTGNNLEKWRAQCFFSVRWKFLRLIYQSLMMKNSGNATGKTKSPPICQNIRNIYSYTWLLLNLSWRQLWKYPGLQLGAQLNLAPSHGSYSKHSIEIVRNQDIHPGLYLWKRLFLSCQYQNKTQRKKIYLPTQGEYVYADCRPDVR